MGRKWETLCIRGHEKLGANFKLKERGHACRACECAISAAYNAMHRKGEYWRECDLQAYADLKYEEFRHEAL